MQYIIRFSAYVLCCHYQFYKETFKTYPYHKTFQQMLRRRYCFYSRSTLNMDSLKITYSALKTRFVKPRCSGGTKWITSSLEAATAVHQLYRALIKYLEQVSVSGQSAEAKSTNANMSAQSIWNIDDDEDDDDPGSLDKVIIKYSDWEIPVTPVKSFEELGFNDMILEALYDSKMSTPWTLQSYLLPLLLKKNVEKNSVVIHAGKGSGKTTSVLLALLHSLYVSANKFSQAIIIYPTVQLVENTLAIVEKFVKSSSKYISYRTVVGRKRKLNKGGEIKERLIIGTPETMVNLVNNNVIDMKNVEMIIFDDIQLMVNNRGHENTILRILQSASTAPQFIFISSAVSTTSTLRSLSNIIPFKQFCPISIEFLISKCNSLRIKSYFTSCEDAAKKNLLQSVIGCRGSFGQIVIICSTQDKVKQVHSDLDKSLPKAGPHLFPVNMLYGKQKRNESIIKDFEIGNIKILVTTRTFTNVKTSNLKTIINYDHFLIHGQFMLDMDHYNNWMNVLANNHSSVMINFVEKRDAQYLLKEAKQLRTVDNAKLITKLLRMQK